MRKFVLQDEEGTTICECGAEITCNENGDMPVECPVCGELLDYTFADNSDAQKWSAVDLILQAIFLGLMEDVPMHRIYQNAKDMIDNDNSELELKIQQIKELRQKAYDLYRLNWMKEHDVGLSDLFLALSNYVSGSNLSDFRSVMEIVNEWELNVGFSGSLWVCFDEFLGAEYLDIDFILGLLPETLRSPYLCDICRLTAYKHAMLIGFTVNGTQFMEEVFVDHADPDEPKLVRFKAHHSRCTAPDVKKWISATIRQDDGYVYYMIEEDGKWIVGDFPF